MRPTKSLQLAVTLFFSLLTAPACVAQTEFPATPAGNQAKAWFAAFNAGDRIQYKEFLSKSFPTQLENVGWGYPVQGNDWRLRTKESRGVDTNKDSRSGPGTQLRISLFV